MMMELNHTFNSQHYLDFGVKDKRLKHRERKTAKFRLIGCRQKATDRGIKLVEFNLNIQICLGVESHPKGSNQRIFGTK